MFPFTLILAILNIVGLAGTLILCGLIFQRYPGGTHYQRSLRNLHLKQVSVLSSLFCLAMTANKTLSTWVLHSKHIR